MRTFAKVLIVVVAVAAVAWSSLFIYWHLKIQSAIRRLRADTEAPVIVKSEADIFRRRPESFRFLADEAGCRALPYLIGSLNPDYNSQFLESVTFLLFLVADAGESLRADGSPVRSPETRHWRIEQGDPVEVRMKKCELAREFWREHAPRYHQMWRIWTKDCFRPAPAGRR